ncbi:MAG: ATP-dependent Clp protease proteolytic subunit [bacterium]
MKKIRDESKERGCLKDYEIIFISGEIDDDESEKVCVAIVEANHANRIEAIQLIVNSSGGSVAAGFAIIDIMEWSRIPIYTTGLGRVSSMGLLIFMAGQNGHRVITENTSMLSHRFWGFASGSHSDLIAYRKEEDLIHERIIRHYLTYTAMKTKEELEKTLLRECDTWLTPDEAVKYGIVDKVEKSRRIKNDE